VIPAHQISKGISLSPLPRFPFTFLTLESSIAVIAAALFHLLVGDFALVKFLFITANSG
jgi:hypothetical protein